MADESPTPESEPTPDTPTDAAPDGAAPEAMVEEGLDAAEKAAGDIAREAGGGSPAIPEFTAPATMPAEQAEALGLLNDVDLKVKIELGRTRMYVEDVLRLNDNSVIELDKAAGDPVDIYVNDRHVARGEVLVVNDNFCVRVSEILDTAGRAG